MTCLFSSPAPKIKSTCLLFIPAHGIIAASTLKLNMQALAILNANSPRNFSDTSIIGTIKPTYGLWFGTLATQYNYTQTLNFKNQNCVATSL